MSWFETIIFSNVTSVSIVKLAGNRAKGSIFGIFEELEFAAQEPSFLRSRKKEERSKHPIENLSETSSQKSKKSCSG
jgi:hypothetical protein